jgi:NAD+ diphosphatase
MNVYSSYELDRSEPRRSDAEWIEARLADPASRLALVWRDQSLASATAEEPAELLVEPSRARALASPLFLGLRADVAYFAADVSALDDPIAELDLEGAGRFEDLRRLGPALPPFEASLLAYARGMAYWHRRHRFCGVCGAATRVERAGHLRVCTNDACATPHFPRTDPAVIVLVTHDDACLLGRQAHWPPRRYSVLAGFVEPGEALEDTVKREVFEESGVVVDDVAYHSSQPWPFPSSLMIGFTARALMRTIDLGDDELEEALWVTRGELRAAVARGDMLLSPPDSISRRLIDEWMGDE